MTVEEMLVKYIFDKKMLEDFMMWKNFEEEYHFDKAGISTLRMILDKLLNKTIEEDKEINDKYIDSYINCYGKKE